MSNFFGLTDAQMVRLQPFFPKSHGKPRVVDRRVLSGVVFNNRNGLRWRALLFCGATIVAISASVSFDISMSIAVSSAATS
jgi:transposase